MGPMVELKTKDAVFQVFGGIDGVCAEFKIGKSLAYNWRANGFPAHRYFQILDRLRRKGYTADRKLWKFADEQ